MEILIVAAGISFVAGAIGYIIVRFWMIPITRYRKLKRQIAAGLSQAPSSAASKTFRRHAGLLGDMYYTEMPHWYKMVLANKAESPEEAARNLNALAGIRKKEDVRQRKEQIRECLNLN
jgi:hypothetical protein